MVSSRFMPMFVAVAFPLALGAQQKTTTPAPSAPKNTATTAVVPSGKDVIDRYVKAIGGREPFDKHNSMHVTGSFDMPAAGISAPLEIYSAKPNKTLVKITVPGMGDIVQGVMGSVAWDMNPASGPRVLAGKELQQRLDNSDFDAALHNPSRYSSIENVGLDNFEGAPAYKLRLVRTSGDTTFEFFDPATGLQRGAQSTAETAMGKIVVTAIFGDYKTFGGMQMPTTITQKMQTSQVTMKLANVEFDTVDPTVFELPAPIKTLVGSK